LSLNLIHNNNNNLSPNMLSVLSANRDVLAHDSEKASFVHIERVESPKPRCLPLRSCLPSTFVDMYAPEVIDDVKHLNALGRPRFTDRALVDWGLNDVRSLLIVCELRPEWNGMLPQVTESGYRMQLLPLDASNDIIVQVLVDSDVYREHGFDERFRIQTAEYTVEAARRRRNSCNEPLTKPEWRNIIENYILNLGCEAQCRLDYKRSCMKLKKQKHDAEKAAKRLSSSPPSSLLKKALLASSATSPDFPSYLAAKPAKPKSMSLSRQEKQQIWVQVQTELYDRLGLDWDADELV